MKLSENIAWTVDGKIKDEEKYKVVMKLITEATYEEEGSLNHEWFIAEDGVTIHIYERYKNTDAALKHLETWSKYASLFMEAAEMTSFNVYGNLTPELKQAVGGASVLMKTYGGFTK
ncbi:putative quinol monooxygenase [Lutibacter citreus]|uniref:putative quinol monooxygenase n=1 Tax=Lutibacter citreus TaxID=2138210 RepID=UPI000DBE883F|nr:hypothetical protein [Lutibacter citreus]